MSTDCLFCQISQGKMSTQFLYEDDIIVVFKDINPMAPVHLLLVPKEHIRSINDLEPDQASIISHMFMKAKEMAKEQGINESGYRLFFNVEKGGGQEVFHLHLHLIGGWKEGRK